MKRVLRRVTVGMVALTLLPAIAANAAAMTVTTTSDSSASATQCTLRGGIAAIEAGNDNTACGSLAASGPTTITLPAGTYDLDAGELHVTGSAEVAIVGADPSQPGSTTIDAGLRSRVFEVDAGAQLSLSAVEVTGGRTPAGTLGGTGRYGGSSADGGGVLNNGSLILDHVIVGANQTGDGGQGGQGAQPADCQHSGLASAPGGASGSGGGIANEIGGVLNITDSLISTNGTGQGGPGADGIHGIGGAFCVSANGGDGAAGASAGQGGGIYNAGQATITGTTIDSNFTGRGGTGGNGGQGADFHAGDPNNPSADPQTAGGKGGNGGIGGNDGPAAAGGTGGGGLANAWLGTLTLTDSTVSNNNTGAGGNGGGAGDGGASGNTTGGAADADSGHGGNGGGGGLGGGLLSYGSAVTLSNVTFTQNVTGDGGAGGSGGGDADASLGGGSGNYGGYGGAIWASESSANGSVDSLSFTNVTIADNSLGAGGPAGSDPRFPGSPGQRGRGAAMIMGYNATFDETNTLVANNGVPAQGDTNCYETSGGETGGEIDDGGGNLSYPDTSCPGINVDPLLGALTNNGGLTQTMLPAVNSPALNVASCALSTDQRGEPRPETGGTACDIGAVERQPIENGNTGTGGGGSTGGGTTGTGSNPGTGSGGSTGTTSTGASGGTTGTGGPVASSPGAGVGSSGPGTTSGTGKAAGAGTVTRSRITFSHISTAGPKIHVTISCRGTAGTRYPLKLTVSAVVIYRGNKLIGVALAKHGQVRQRRVTVILATAALNLQANQTRTVTLVLDSLGATQLRLRHGLNVTLTGKQTSGVRTTALLDRKLHLSAK
jgi:hypothetical protein